MILKTPSVTAASRQGADETAAVQALINAASDGDTITLEGRPYYLNSPVKIPNGVKNLTLQGVAGKTEFVPISDTGYVLRVGWDTGSVFALDAGYTKRPSIDDNVTLIYAATPPVREDTTIVIDDTVTTAPEAGDIWVLYDLLPETDRTVATPSTNLIGMHTWVFKVESYVAGTKTITVTESSGTCPQPFAASAKIAKLTGETTYGVAENITINDIRFRGRNTLTGSKVNYLLIAQCVFGLNVNRCEAIDWNDYPFDFHACTDVELNDLELKRGETVSTGRGIGIHACHNFTINRPVADRFYRHVVLVTDGSSRGNINNGVAGAQMVATDAAWDCHGNKSYNITFDNCSGGWVHIGNDSFVNGDDSIYHTYGDYEGVRIQGGGLACQISHCTIEQGIEISSKKLPDNTTWFRGGSVVIKYCTIGNMSDGGCINLVNSPGLTELDIEDCLIVDESTVAANGTIMATDFVQASEFAFTLKNNVIIAVKKADTNPIVRWWGANTAVGTLTLVCTGNRMDIRGAKPFEFRSTGFTDGTADISDNEFGGLAKLNTSASLATSWDTSVTLTAAGNTFSG